MERTLLIVKPDAFPNSFLIQQQLLSNGFILFKPKERVRRGYPLFKGQHVGMRSMGTIWDFTHATATGFYRAHVGADFFTEHINFMCSGHCMVFILTAENAVKKLRTFVGATDPRKAEPGTLRAQYGTGLPQNAVHASDSVANAAREIAYLFAGYELGQVLD